MVSYKTSFHSTIGFSAFLMKQFNYLKKGSQIQKGILFSGKVKMNEQINE